MTKKILNEETIALERVKELLLERDEEDAPLNYIQRVTLDYAFRFSKDIPKSELLIEKLLAFHIPREEIIQLVTVNPEELDDLVLVLSDIMSDEKKKEILQVVLDHKEEFQDVIVASKDKDKSPAPAPAGYPDDDTEFEDDLEDEDADF